MSKVLILFCGGTISMERGEGGILMVREKEKALKSLRAMDPRMYELAQIEIEFIDNIDSANITPQHWDQLTAAIENHYEKYDGFIITHGTDTMAYTASALTFSLQNSGKPVILTGAQISSDEIGSDARTNLINSLRVVLLDIAGVYIVFEERVILGARSSKVSESRLSAFATKNAPDIGEIRTDIRLRKNIQKRHSKPLDAQSGFESNILVITLIPGRNIDGLLKIVKEGETKGLIIRAYSTGNIPYEFLPVLEEAQRQKIPVVVTTQCLHGSTAMGQYDVGVQALKLNAIQLYDISLECAVTKFMWVLRRYSYGQVGKIMQRDFVGEINVDGRLYE